MLLHLCDIRTPPSPLSKLETLLEEVKDCEFFECTLHCELLTLPVPVPVGLGMH